MPAVTPGGSTRTVVVAAGPTATVTRESVDVARVQVRSAVAAAAENTRAAVAAAMGPQGPRGEQGVPGPPGAAALQRTAATTLGGHRVVRAAADGTVAYADAFDATHGDDTLGLTTGAAEAGQPVTVLTTGPIEHVGWAWASGEPVFLIAGGQLAQAEAVGAAFEQVIGFAETPTRLFIQIQPPVFY